MIKPLRKRHLQIWWVFLVLLPAGIFSARLVTPRPIYSKLLQPVATEALPVLIQSVEQNSYIINVRSNNQRDSFQLEWINKLPLKVPSALIYMKGSAKGVTDGLLIGRIEARGTYHVPLNEDPVQNHTSFILYDYIGHKSIDTLNF